MYARFACNINVTAIESERNTRSTQFVPGNLTQPEFLKMCSKVGEMSVEASGKKLSRKVSRKRTNRYSLRGDGRRKQSGQGKSGH